ncbi:MULTISPECIES: DUF167 family protein [Hyphomonas]|uniref:UPF0235 protein DCG58_18240 n=1 Tax=Hyphomonas adhaerens TaxID=81029 RepID=A0A3B9H4D3_9PROT|nr:MULTISPECIES: DUF167 family protein [Hyphomonas]MBB41202.1 hypothetical protein [Hyphomonas sp.]HAE29104.1 hypothetical protein [Hyphomonas adhaerens]
MLHRLTVRVQPKASADRIEDWAEDDSGRRFLKVRVRAVPEDGKANSAVQKLVAKWLGLPKSAVRVVTGGKTRLKGLEIDGPPDLAARLSGDER